MFKKVLIAEDHESSNFSVQNIVKQMEITVADYFYYCDDAYSHLKKSVAKKLPYELLITDLSFEDDGRKQLIKDGKQLIKCCREENPNIKVIVFSGEHRLGVIDLLFRELKINAFVRKARSDSRELKKAIELVYCNHSYISNKLKPPIKKVNTLEFSNYDIILLTLLSEGILQKNIPQILQQRNINPNSLSSVEKRISTMKIAMDVKNNEQLIARCKDLGII